MVWKNGDAAASACTVEQTSWAYPGRVSSLVRQPPPGSAAPSMTSTASPALASVIAAASPLGPEPTTTASGCLTTAPRPARTCAS